MAIYEYENGLGERREVTAPMSAPPPEFVCIGADGSWTSAMMIVDKSPCKELWARVYGAGLRVSVPDYAVKYGKAPASRSLPRRRGGKLDRLNGHAVMRHSDGGYTTLDGRPIIQNKADAQREQGRTGYKRA